MIFYVGTAYLLHIHIHCETRVGRTSPLLVIIISFLKVLNTENVHFTVK